MTDCIFCKIAAGTIPANIVYQNDAVVAFRDLNPQAPTHVLVIPKKHIATTNDIAAVDADLIGGFILTVGDKQFDSSIASGLNRLKKDFSQKVIA